MGLVAKSSSYMVKYLRISSIIRKPFLIYDFVTVPIWISLCMRNIFFAFLSLYSKESKITYLGPPSPWACRRPAAGWWTSSPSPSCPPPAPPSPQQRQHLELMLSASRWKYWEGINSKQTFIKQAQTFQAFLQSHAESASFFLGCRIRIRIQICISMKSRFRIRIKVKGQILIHIKLKSQELSRLKMGP